MMTGKWCECEGQDRDLSSTSPDSRSPQTCIPRLLSSQSTKSASLLPASPSQVLVSRQTQAARLGHWTCDGTVAQPQHDMIDSQHAHPHCPPLVWNQGVATPDAVQDLFGQSRERVISVKVSSTHTFSATQRDADATQHIA